MTSGQNTLIIQFQCSGSLAEFDWLVGIEEVLIQGFSQNDHAIVDGHDFGVGTMNIFIFPKGGWSATIDVVKAYLKHRKALDRAIIIKRSKTERYTVVWPENYTGEFERL